MDNLSNNEELVIDETIETNSSIENANENASNIFNSNGAGVLNAAKRNINIIFSILILGGVLEIISSFINFSPEDSDISTIMGKKIVRTLILIYIYIRAYIHVKKGTKTWLVYFILFGGILKTLSSVVLLTQLSNSLLADMTIPLIIGTVLFCFEWASMLYILKSSKVKQYTEYMKSKSN